MSRIEWTTKTWNPVTGCDRVSPGCDHCYALTMSARLKAMGQEKYQTDGRPETSGPGFGVQTHPDTLEAPLRWRKPARVFVNSMSDLFHPQVPALFVGQVFNIMGTASQHTFQVLTKRPKRMRAVVSAYYETTGQAPLSNVWLGTSVEDQQRADERIPALLATPAAVRFISAEPLLGPVDLRGRCDQGCSDGAAGFHNPTCPATRVAPVDWVIIGGESDPGARPMDLAWAEDIVDQCIAAGIAPFVKQLGSRWGKQHHDMRLFPTRLRVREYPQPPSRCPWEAPHERDTTSSPPPALHPRLAPRADIRGVKAFPPDRTLPRLRRAAMTPTIRMFAAMFLSVFLFGTAIRVWLGWWMPPRFVVGFLIAGLALEYAAKAAEASRDRHRQARWDHHVAKIAEREGTR